MNYRRLSFGEKVKGFLGAPSNTFDDVGPEALGSALKYFAIWAVIYAVLQTIVFYTLGGGVFQALAGLLGLNATAVYDFNPVASGLMALLGAFASLFISAGHGHTYLFGLSVGEKATGTL